MSSFLEQLLILAPPGESPYEYAATLLGNVLPEKAGWFFWMLGLGSIVNAFNLILNFVCIYMVGARHKLGDSSPYWFVRLQYDHSSGVPYIVPNALMMFLLFNGIFALLMQPYIWIVSLSSVRLADIAHRTYKNYITYKHRTRLAPETGLFFWYGFIFIFDGSGMWISAFGTFYATLLPQLLISPNYAGIGQVLVHPAFLNALCYGLPLALLVAQVITSAQSQIAWHDMLLLEFDVVDNLNILSRQWKSGGIDQSLWNQTLVISKPLLGKILESRAAFVRNAATTGAWYTLCFVFFTPSAVWLLYTLHRTIERKLWVPDLQLEALGPISSLHPPSSRTSGSEQTTPTSAASLTPEYQDAQAQERVHDPGGKTAKKLQTAFYSAMLQFIATGFCLGAAAGSWIWAATDARVNINPTLHALAVILSVWVYSIVGIAVNMFICSIAMSFGGSHRSAGSLSANQAPPSPFANKLRLANPSGTLLPPIPPPAPLGLPDMDTISLESNRSKPQPIPPRRSTSPLRGTSAFDRSMDPEIEDEEETPWGERPAIASSPMSSSPGMNRFASSFATRVNALFADSHQNKPRMSDAEIEAEAERSREASRREAERILTEEAEARRKVEEATLAQRAKEREQQQRMMERAQLGRPVTPTRGMSLSPVASPKREGTKEGESSWWEMAKSKLTPTKEKDLTPSQQIVAEARKQEKEREKDKGKKSIDWPATPGIRSTDPTLLAMAAASRLAASPINDNQFMSGTLSSSPERQQTYSPKPIMPHEQLAREIEAQGGGRINGDFFGTRLSTDGAYMSTPSKSSLPFVSRATPSPAPSPLQPARAQTSPEQIGLSSAGTPLGGRSPNVSPERLPHLEKDKKFSPVEDKDKVAEREKEKDRRTATTITTTTTNDDAPPLYAQFTPAGALDVALTLLTVARRFEKLEKWTVGHVRALEERMKDVERYLVDKEAKSDAVGKEIAALKTGIQDIRRNMETLRESIPPPAPPPPPPQAQPQPQPQPFLINPPATPARRAQPSDADSARMRAMSSTSASSYATALSALNGELSNAAAVRTSVISLGSVEEDGIDVRPSVAEVVTPMAVRQPLPPAPSTSASTSSFGSPLSESAGRASLTSPRASGSSSRDFKSVVPSAAKDFTPPPPLDRVSSANGGQPQSPPGGPRSRLPYPTGDYTANGQSVSPLSATAAQFPMPPGASNSTLTLSATAPLSIDKEKQKERDETPLGQSSRGQRAESVSPTPRKRYTVALSGGDDNQRPASLPTQTAVFTTAPHSVSSPSSSSGRSRSQSTYSTAPQPPPSPSPASGSNRLRRAVSSSTDGGLASVYAQTEDWEDVRGKVLTPRLGEPKFVDPLVIRRKGAAGKDAGSKPLPGAGRGKVPISQLVKFFDGDK
ncbi:unnamed protein product [Rhizoctonia solani]|uniref:Uncharacterized protein n=2 Tax=Rhizoctonia solani TaxID=456999 RepID=A0A8H2XWZ7_9AGAM|nr:unnamed protein product [Rhizoctonia solani]